MELARTKQTARRQEDVIAQKRPADSMSEVEEPEIKKNVSQPHDPAGDDQEYARSQDKKEYMQSYWFISKDGKVVVEAHGSNDDKEYAVTWNLTSPFRTQSITTADGGKQEAFLNDEYYLLRKYWRKWSKSERWVVDRRIDKLFSEKDLSAVMLKSKCLLFYYSYLSDR